MVTRPSPNAVYDASLASFSESGGLFSQTASPGFIELWSLQSRMAWRLRNRVATAGSHAGMTRLNGNRYGILGYVVWQGGKWYLRKRLPSGARLALTGVGAASVLTAAVVLAKRLSA